jgi:hypothetical protein
MSDIGDHDIYELAGRPSCRCACGCRRRCDVLVYIDDPEGGDRVEAQCAWCAVRFDTSTSDTRSVVNAWNKTQWCYQSRHDWLVSPELARWLMAHAYADTAAGILGADRVRTGTAVDDMLPFVGRTNWSMLPERRAAHLIEHPETDPARPFTVQLHDTGDVHSGQLQPEAQEAPVLPF